MKKQFDKGFLAPMPVLILGTYDEAGNANAMNAAWGGQVGGSQISVTLSSHRTTDNIRKSGAFTIAFATAEQVAACDYVGMVSQNKVPDKLTRCGFTVTKSDKVNAPVIDQLPVSIECRVLALQEEFGETRVVAEIVGMQADESVLTDGKVDLSKLHLLAFDAAALCYRVVGDSVGAAWSAGKIFS